MATDERDPVLTVTDALNKGVRGFVRIVERVMDKNKMWKLFEVEQLEKIVLVEFVGNTNHRPYIDSIKEYFKELKTAVSNLEGTLEEFKSFIVQNKNLETWYKKFDDAYHKLESITNDEKGVNQSQKLGNSLSALNKILTDFYKDETAEIVEKTSRILGVQYDGRTTATNWKQLIKDIMDKRTEIHNYSVQKGNNQAKNTAFFTFFQEDQDLEDLRMFLDKWLKSTKSRFENMPDKIRKEFENKKNLAFEQVYPTIDTYLEWYENDKKALDVGGKNLVIEEHQKNMLDVMHIRRLFAVRLDPFKGLDEYFTYTIREYQILIDKASKNKNDKSVPTDLVKKIVGLMSAFPLEVRNAASDEIKIDSDKTKKFLDSLKQIGQAAQRITDGQVSYLQSVGKAHVVTQSESKSKQDNIDLGSNQSYYTSGSQFNVSSSGWSAGQNISDDRRKLDHLMANEAPSILSRKVKISAMQLYMDQLRRFVKKTADSNSTLHMLNMILETGNENIGRANEDIRRQKNMLANSDAAYSHSLSSQQQEDDEESKYTKEETDQPGGTANEKLKGGGGGGVGNVDEKIREIGKKKKGLMLSLIRNVENVFDEYAQMHADFALKYHRDGMRYMIYWRNITLQNQDARNILREYFEMLKELVKIVDVQTEALRDAFRKSVTGENAEKYPQLARWSVAMPSDAQEEITARVQRTEEHLEDIRRNTIYLYEGSGSSVQSIVTSLPFLMMYAVKLLRMLFVWASLHFAEHVFQLWYVRVAYGKNKDPPSPVYMIILFILIDLAMNLALLSVLYLLRTMFGSAPHHGFPINDRFIYAFVVDYACTTLAIFALAAVIADIVRTKKYFRYRYEGERGIRALQIMTLYLSIIILLLPFFRLV